MPLLEANSISKSFGGVHALRGVSFELREGEVHALVGENGAGKSTFIKIVTGALQPDAGSLSVCGEVVERNSPTIARTLGIAAIYQQPALFPDLTVAENLALTLEEPALWRTIDWKARSRKAAELLGSLGASIEPDRIAGTLSMPEQQLVEIAKAIAAEAKIVIMDEPTASLADREVDELFRVIRDLRSRGVGILYISHRLEEISAIGDRVTVFRDGETVGTSAIRDVDRAALIRQMVGRDVTAVFPKRKVPIGATVLEVCNLVSQDAGVHDASFRVRAGEIVGVAGLVGSGRTQLAETLFGITPADSGGILVCGHPIHILSPNVAIGAGLAYLPEDRRRHGVILNMAVAENISLANLKAVSRAGLIQAGSERDLAETYRTRFRVKTPSVDTEAGDLSGGNQQKVALARWLATQPAVLILDEPTQGVDVGSKAEIHELIVELAEQGLAILLISSELPEVLGMCDRILVMHEGAIVRTLDRAEATQEGILQLALGHFEAEAR